MTENELNKKLNELSQKSLDNTKKMFEEKELQKLKDKKKQEDLQKFIKIATKKLSSNNVNDEQNNDK